MLKQFFKFIGAEWEICLFYAAIIFGLNGISAFYTNDTTWINIILFVIGFGVSCGFIITTSKLIHNDNSIGNKFKYMLMGKDKLSYDIFILLVFFSVILIPFKGLVLVLTIIPFGKNLVATIQATPYLPLTLSLLFMVVSCMYKTAIYTGLANLVHNQKEVLESFKYGIKNILKMYSVILILILFSIASIIIIRLGNNSTIAKTIVDTINYTVPGFLILMVSCNLEGNNQPETLEELSIE